ncbi:MAG: M24 family metallopeptidase [Candidatus Hermodarchaeota archaeon]
MAEPIGYDKKRASEILEKFGVDALVATTPVNVFYTTGIPTLHVAPNPILFVLYNQYPSFSIITNDGEVCLLIWVLYDSIEKFSWVKDYERVGSPKAGLKLLEEKLESFGLRNGKIGIETLMPRYQSEFLRREFPNATFVDGDKIFLEMRLIKSEEEINRIKKSTQIAEKAILNCIDSLKEGITDIELLKIARRSIVNEGAEGWDHLTMNIGDSDPEAPGVGTVVKPGDMVRFDYGAVWKGYVSDVSRDAVVGQAPEKGLKAMENMINVQEFCLDNLKPGADPKELYESAFKYFKQIGKGRCTIIGHSIGLETEETHIFGPGHIFDGPIKENMVLDVEAWQIVRGQGLVGIEDCYRITTNGCERLSSLDKEIFYK